MMILCLWWGQDRFAAAQVSSTIQSLKPTIFVNVDASTWKTRGRLLYDIEGTILKKLNLAGFQPVRDVTVPHEFELSVNYREERGEHYHIDAWGTIIRGNFRFTGMTLPHAFTWEVVEYSENSISGSPPYLDVLIKFETYPLYFFLGEMLMYLVETPGHMHEGLQHVLEERVANAYPLSSLASDGATSQDHFMDSSHVVYQDIAFQRTIDELRRRRHSERDLISIARKVSYSPSRTLRLQAVEILGSADDQGSCLRLQVLAGEDSDIEVRKQAGKHLLHCLSGDRW